MSCGLVRYRAFRIAVPHISDGAMATVVIWADAGSGLGRPCDMLDEQECAQGRGADSRSAVEVMGERGRRVARWRLCPSNGYSFLVLRLELLQSARPGAPLGASPKSNDRSLLRSSHIESAFEASPGTRHLFHGCSYLLKIDVVSGGYPGFPVQSKTWMTSKARKDGVCVGGSPLRSIQDPHTTLTD